MPRARPANAGILEITPYVGGKAPKAGLANAVKLSSNENPLGPSPKAIAAAQEVAARAHLYPSSDHLALREAIARVYGLDPDWMICGNGSDEIISLLCQAFVAPGDEVLYSAHAFSMYRLRALASGGTPVVAPERDRTTDVDALIARLTQRTRLVFVANPNNPTGTMTAHEEIARLARAIPDQALLVLDGAYAEFVPEHDGYANLVKAHENVVMTRTFSKIYGLGGLRIGWGYAQPPVLDILGRVRDPFNINALALAAAEAAVEDTDYVAFCLAENARWRDWLATELAGLGIPSDPSHCNFILARFTDAAHAQAAYQTLEDNGLIVRPMGSYNLPECLRITIGQEQDCRRLAEVLRGFMETSR